MKTIRIPKSHRYLGLLFILSIALCHAAPPQAQAHGGKTHEEQAFTAFHAAQKAMGLYDRLIGAGKLTESWETGLTAITVSFSDTAGKREFIVRFERAEGDPRQVYFFFGPDGEYTGSNFTGK